MYMRATQVRSDPARLGEVIANFKDRVLPDVRGMPGYAGVALLIDRASGDGYAGTYWSDLASMNAAEQAVSDLRRQSSEATGAEVLDVDRFEIVIAERRGSAVPSFSRVNQLYADPSRAGAAVEFLRGTVVPALSSMDGFLAVAAFLNRMTGRTVVTSTWATPEARAASGGSITGLRQQAVQTAGADDVRVQELEVAFLEMKDL